jgi:hypothetical protein
MTARPILIRVVLCATILFGAAGMPALARGAAPPDQDPSKPAALASIPVRVDVTLTRSQGEKKISSLPFSLLANATDARNLPEHRSVSMRMGIDVPIGSATTTDSRTQPSGSGVTQSTGSTSTKVQYRNVGTDIDCLVTRLDDSRFSVRLSVSDSSIYSPDSDQGKALRNPDPAAFRTFSTSNTVPVRDAQTVLFGVGTDKISGETLKIEVTLHVVK